MGNELTIRKIRDTEIHGLYSKLLLKNYMSISEQEAILKLALVFINEDDKQVKDLGYRIILMYANNYQNYQILYDIAINNGLIPISKFIENKFLSTDDFEKSFFNIFSSSYMELYNSKDNKNIYLTEEQKKLNSFFNETYNKTISIVAPTSYGKSDIIISSLKNSSNLNICIIVPTKALLEQTKRRIMDANISHISKIITYPEMYQSNDNKIVAVMTQERLLRLLKNNLELNFDTVFVDEAHNLLENDDRTILLASAITIVNKRNTNVAFKFLTPFLMDSSSLKVSFTNYTSLEYRITEYIKSEKLYLYDFRENREHKLKIYDQFLNKLFLINSIEYKDDIELILSESGNKNIIYFNRPINIEEFTKKFLERLPIVHSETILKACRELKKHLHKDYNLIDALNHGIIYHHGSVPNYIRLYIEHLFKTEEEIKYVITSSTLLEGVNIPADVLFLLENKKGRGGLTASQFKNLIGRVSRFSEVFNSQNGSMHLLEPKIYLIASKYIAKNANIENFIENVMKIDKKITDKVNNPLLEKTTINDNNRKVRTDAENFIENFEIDTIKSDNISYATTKIGKLCFENNVVEIDIIQHEDSMQKIITNAVEQEIQIDDAKNLFDAIYYIFLKFLKTHQKYDNLKRFSNDKARLFYAKFLNWKIKNTSYSEMISSFLYYWKYLEDNDKETFVYVDKWGELTRDGHKPMWVDIKEKTHKERVNLAIVRIQEEQEYLDNVLIKFIDILFELNLLDNDFYNNMKFGTTNIQKIVLSRNGLSMSLANLLIDKYSSYVTINQDTNNYNIASDIIDIMRSNDENDIMIFETKYNI